MRSSSAAGCLAVQAPISASSAARFATRAWLPAKRGSAASSGRPIKPASLRNSGSELAAISTQTPSAER